MTNFDRVLRLSSGEYAELILKAVLKDTPEISELERALQMDAEEFASNLVRIIPTEAVCDFCADRKLYSDCGCYCVDLNDKDIIVNWLMKEVEQ